MTTKLQPESPVSPVEIKNLIEARKLMKNSINISWYWVIFMIGFVAPVWFLPLLLIGTVPISIAWILYLIIVPPRRLKRNLANLKVKVHETRNLSVGDFCRPCQDDLPLYKVVAVTTEPKFLELMVILSKKSEEIGTMVENQREQFVIPYVYKD